MVACSAENEAVTTQSQVVECSEIWQPSNGPVFETGDPEVLVPLGDEIRGLMDTAPDGVDIVAVNDNNPFRSVWVTVHYRDAAVIGTIAEIDSQFGEGTDVCFDLPPIGFYDEPRPEVPWGIAAESLPVAEHWRSLTLVPGWDCGIAPRTLLPAEVTYGVDEIEIVIRSGWSGSGADDLACSSLVPVTVALTEDPAGRPLVWGCETANCVDGPAPEATPAPVPPPTPGPAGGLDLTGILFVDEDGAISLCGVVMTSIPPICRNQVTVLANPNNVDLGGLRDVGGVSVSAGPVNVRATVDAAGTTIIESIG